MAVTVAIYVIGLLSPDLDVWLTNTFAQANWLVADGDWWRIFTAALLHGSLLHIGFNMYALYLFGPRMEQQVGSVPFAALYLAAAGAGGLVSYLIGPLNQVSIGASGAIFGLFGAWIFVAWKMRNTPGGRSMFTQLFVLLAINVVISFSPGIDGLAHLGGFVAGLGIAALWSVFAAGKANAVGIRTAIAGAVVAIDLVAVLMVAPF
ncbi:MAG: rhomboid family intramembrane serine protease [Acidimicrobiia bacterium]